MNKEPTMEQELAAAEYRYLMQVQDAVDAMDAAELSAAETLDREIRIITNRFKYQMN